jgi:hypothetical protein
MRRAPKIAAVLGALLAGASGSARADEMLDKYFEAMSKSRLLATETGSADAMRELAARGEQLFLDGRHADALVVLVEVVDSPRFADYRELPEGLAAEHMLAATHVQLGSYRTALKYLDRSRCMPTRRSPCPMPSARRSRSRST